MNDSERLNYLLKHTCIRIRDRESATAYITTREQIDEKHGAGESDCWYRLRLFNNMLVKENERLQGLLEITDGEDNTNDT